MTPSSSTPAETSRSTSTSPRPTACASRTSPRPTSTPTTSPAPGSWHRRPEPPSTSPAKAERTGSTAFDGRRLRDGDTITVGNLTIAVDHTPGHTPEHLSLKLTDGAAADEPGYLFTGDFVFVGDLGRPDLLDEAAGGVDTRYEGAKQMFASLRDKLLALPDYVQIYPAHGSGSACGKALGAVPTTTVGYERNFSWWSRYVANDDEQGFIDELRAGPPDAPAYFGRMKRQNRDGPAVLGHRESPSRTRRRDREERCRGRHRRLRRHP